MIDALHKIGRNHAVVWPAHPRTIERIKEFGLNVESKNVRMIDPVGYLDFLCLQDNAAAVVTDSGGIQEETTFLGVPCFTVRPNTERPVTLSQGTNQLFDNNPDALADAVCEAAQNGKAADQTPQYWDGKAAGRIADVLGESELD